MIDATDADIVCSRARNHYSPGSNLQLEDMDDDRSAGSSKEQLEKFKQEFKGLHESMKKVMYFS